MSPREGDPARWRPDSAPGATAPRSPASELRPLRGRPLPRRLRATRATAHGSWRATARLRGTEGARLATRVAITSTRTRHLLPLNPASPSTPHLQELRRWARTAFSPPGFGVGSGVCECRCGRWAVGRRQGRGEEQFPRSAGVLLGWGRPLSPPGSLRAASRERCAPASGSLALARGAMTSCLPGHASPWGASPGTSGPACTLLLGSSKEQQGVAFSR